MSLPPNDQYIGEPDSPPPWATRQPREGMRDTDAARIVSLAPDVCLTPVGSSVVPVPYPVHDLCGHDENYTPSVRMTGQKTMVLRSNTTHVHGDAPGTRKGVVSGTVGDVCEPVGHAGAVRAEGSNVIRHLDRCKMNAGNTEGEAIFVRDQGRYEPPADTDPVKGSMTIEAEGDDRANDAERNDAEPADASAPGVTAVVRRGSWGDAAVLPANASDGPAEYAYVRPMPGRPYIPLLGPRFPPQLRPIPRPPKPNLDPKPVPGPVPPPMGNPDGNVRVDEECPFEQVCFLPKPKHKREEFRKQLKMQEGALNQLTPSRYLARRGAFGPSIKALAESARDRYRRNYRRRYDYLKGRGAFDRDFKGEDALHRLDSVAGGDPTDIARMGGGYENQTIGSQWSGYENPKNKSGSQKRVEKVDAHAEKLKARGCELMRVILEICELYDPELMA